VILHFVHSKSKPKKYFQLKLRKTKNFISFGEIQHGQHSLAAVIAAIAIFTARCYASAILAMGLCLSVSSSQVGVLLKRLNIRSQKQHDTIAQGL